jgi:hypothetical protein
MLWLIVDVCLSYLRRVKVEVSSLDCWTTKAESGRESVVIYEYRSSKLTYMITSTKCVVRTKLTYMITSKKCVVRTKLTYMITSKKCVVRTKLTYMITSKKCVVRTKFDIYVFIVIVCRNVNVHVLYVGMSSYYRSTETF